jgi:hypothetical protein
VLESYGLGFKSVPEAVGAVIETLGLSPCEGTGAVKPGATKHNAYLAGVFLGGIKTLGRMQARGWRGEGGWAACRRVWGQCRDAGAAAAGVAV